MKQISPNASTYFLNKLKSLETKYSSLLVIEAIKRSAEAEAKHPFAYINRILEKWNAANVHNLEDINEYEKKHNNSRKTNKAVTKRYSKTVRTELAPGWLKEENTPSTVEDNGQASEDERKRLEEVLKKYKRD
ncbi:DnaD domain protein [Bacillus cereus]|uniref:DnaD domain protein n=1 Tax=Bacillus cereus TaxID=1396 RepID=UPI003012F266